MIIFINDVPVRILKGDEQPDQGKVNSIVDAAEGPLTQAKLIHHVWIQNVSSEDVGVCQFPGLKGADKCGFRCI